MEKLRYAPMPSVMISRFTMIRSNHFMMDLIELVNEFGGRVNSVVLHPELNPPQVRIKYEVDDTDVDSGFEVSMYAALGSSGELRCVSNEDIVSWTENGVPHGEI